MSNNENFRQILKSAGYSLTAARTAVFEALLGHEPLSMHELIVRAGKVDRASVYRTVDLFERLGIVVRLNIGWKYKLELTDKFAEHHHHLTCIRCGKTISMNENELERLIAELATAHHFRAIAHQIELQGLCQECQLVG